MKRRKDELEFGEITVAPPLAQTGGGNAYDSRKSRKQKKHNTAKRVEPNHRKEEKVTEQDDSPAIESTALTSPSDWFFAQFLKSCGKTLSQIEQERSIPGKLTSGITFIIMCGLVHRLCYEPDCTLTIDLRSARIDSVQHSVSRHCHSQALRNHQSRSTWYNRLNYCFRAKPMAHTITAREEEPMVPLALPHPAMTTVTPTNQSQAARLLSSSAHRPLAVWTC